MSRPGRGKPKANPLGNGASAERDSGSLHPQTHSVPAFPGHAHLLQLGVLPESSNPAGPRGRGSRPLTSCPGLGAPGARDACSQSTCSAGPRALGAGRPHLASAPGAAGRSLGFHLRRRAAQPGVRGPRGGPARGAHGMEHVARGGERSWGRRRLSGFFAQATGRLWNLRSGFQGVPSGRRGQCVTVMSVRRGGSLATPSPGPAPADGSRDSDSDSDSDSGAWVCGSQRRARGRRPGGRTRPGRGKAV